MELIEMKINEEDGFCCTECGNESIKLIEINECEWLCKQCLERALAIVKGEGNVG